jgi:hydroxyacylglutathione hydrolase
MQILVNSGGVAMTNCFLVADETAKEAVMFDAPDHTAGPLLDQAQRQGWKVTGLWLTHGHFDHFADHPVVRRHFPEVRVLIHPLDGPKAQDPDFQTSLFSVPLRIPPLNPDGHLTDGQQLKIGSLEVQVLHTPGHSPGSVVYYFPKEGVLIGGDLIIGGSVGRTDLPDSSHKDLEASLRRVMALPPSTRLLGGHGPETTLAEERETNYFLQQALSRGR